MSKSARVKFSKGHFRNVKRAERLRRERASALARFDAMTPNEISAAIQETGAGFLDSVEWKTLRSLVLDKYGRCCMKCGFKPRLGQRINVDHIKPRAFYPELALEFDNLQVLCGPCNKAKGNHDMTDYRPAPSPCRSFV